MHIDDPRSPEIKLPSLSKCMKLKPSQIIAKLLPKPEPKEEAIATVPESAAVDADMTNISTANEAMDETAAVEDIDVEIVESGNPDTEEMMEEDDDSMPPLEGDELQATIKVLYFSIQWLTKC